MLSMNIKAVFDTQILNVMQIRHHHSRMKPFRVSAHVYNRKMYCCVPVCVAVHCVCVFNYPSLIKESGQGVTMETQLYTSCHSD